MHHHKCITCCNARLTPVIPTQQQNPMRIGFPPDLISFTISVFKPIAVMASTIKNLLTFLRKENTFHAITQTVVSAGKTA